MLAYFDCFSGISGDMTLGAFIDLGIPVEWLKENLSRLPLTGFDLSTTPVRRSGIQAKSVRVIVEDGGTARDYAEIKDLLQNSPLSENVRSMSLKIFDKIADAEATIHGCAKDDVHFHEVGGVDALVDIVGTALCMEYLDIDRVIASKIPVGRGFISCQHGTLPVPAPATIAILEGVPVYGTDIPYELVTPTGAAIIVALADSFGAMPNMVVGKTGYGAGERDLENQPNLLRIITGTVQELQTDIQADTITVVETCIDDMNPEVFGFLMDRLFDDGALDVYWIPVFMKKNRPGTMVQVLCRKDRKSAIIHRILSETTSLGVRFYNVHRAKLEREEITIESIYGTVSAKRVTDPQGSVRVVPEYESCKKIALEKNIPIRIVYDTILRSIGKYPG
ncbi:nickel pincer cofactor biosynthesis protein LarC [Thermodesulfobacteriota bacterium]